MTLPGPGGRRLGAARPTVLVVAGTRPEVLKLAPVLQALNEEHHHSRVRPVLCLTGQHRELVEDLVRFLRLDVAHRLDAMGATESVSEVAGKVLQQLPAVFEAERPAMTLVQGDTVSALAGALVAYYEGVPVGHVEAGLRTGRLDEPFPEEGNRRMITAVSSIHFAPTHETASNLRREGIAGDAIEVTGNTVVDSLQRTRARLLRGVPPGIAHRRGCDRDVVLVTVHRRENREHRLRAICEAVRRIADENDVHVVFPLHPSRRVRAEAIGRLSGHPRIALLEPLDHASMVGMLLRSRLVLTDSGGLQEEAVTAARPVLVLRESTDRPEGVATGLVHVVGWDVETVVARAADALRGGAVAADLEMTCGVYGDGRAGERIAAAVVRRLTADVRHDIVP